LPLPFCYSVGIINRMTQAEGKHMIGYNQSKIARMEHEERVQTHLQACQFKRKAPRHEPGWSVRQIGSVFLSVGNALTVLGKRMSQEQEPSPATPLPDHG